MTNITCGVIIHKCGLLITIQSLVAVNLYGLDKNTKAVIMDKIGQLEEHGLTLLRTNMMKRIQNKDKDFYELIGGRSRIALYYEVISNSFILLHGFIKKRQREIREINIARSRLHEYKLRRQIQ